MHSLPRLIITLTTFVMGLQAVCAHAEWFAVEKPIMGTAVSAQFWHDDSARGTVLKQQVIDIMQDVDQRMSPYIDTSEISQLNTYAYKKPVTVSDNLFAILQKAAWISSISAGTFDITFASIGYRYNFRKGERPSQDDIQQSLAAINYQHIVLDEQQKTVRFLHPDVRIDLGGIAKGYAVDSAIEMLQESGVNHAVVAAGGDTRILGDKRGKPWMFGIRHPRKPNDHAVIMPLTQVAISTSGDYERYFMDGDERVHHIIHPTKGTSATGMRSASVLTQKSIDADALSTTVFVLGVEKGLNLINGLPDTEAILIDDTGKLHYSDGLLRQQSTQPTSPKQLPQP
ncbi:FAD:protein FMN transferase [BD1-7 clade bacterium]|uniref:FAD:protein FMN transferase n=1 Tax=BD1-7 clade bacterium TaxID=2029982 RepID=A0A5S9P6C3_9GAMM|nr:FAD:protein FMN transferase [BD1-7 clade bacterium]CAA0099050.1 FAD:protein FMN transferase [BD1-7 clade bacterium]